MKIEIARAIVEEADNAGLELSLYEDYSGRGMYGRKTAGIVTPGMGQLLAAVAATAASRVEAGEDVEDLILALQQVSQDSMGRDTIVY